MNKVVVKAPAKLNLTLDILGIDGKGYHLMDMIMQAVSLYEEITLIKSNDINLAFTNSSVPVNEKNTAYKAAVLFFTETGLLSGVDITITKTVPIRAGMAGGSADAAGVLVGLNKLYNSMLCTKQLCELGAKIGADVPFCIVGGTAHVTGIGEIIKKVPNCPDCFFTVCMPQQGVSTPQAFARYDEIGTDKRPNTQNALHALKQNSLAQLCKNMYNAMQFSSESKHNKIICDILLKNNALSALMTGSGAAVFGVFDNEYHAIKAKEELEKTYNNCMVLKPVSHGAYVV